MTRWVAFSVLLFVVTLGVVGLARTSARAFEEGALDDIGGRALRWNVVASQALVAGVVVAGAWIAGVPPEAFGWRGFESGGVETASRLGLGAVLGAGIAVGNLALERGLSRETLRDARDLRRRLAPGTLRGWVTLLLIVIPTIAVAEELLFRGALVGALAVGFDLSPWLLLAISSVAFGAAHTAQGAVGVAVASLFGFVLGGAFVLTGDLLVVIVAHATVDTVEFVGHEGPFETA